MPHYSGNLAWNKKSRHYWSSQR